MGVINLGNIVSKLKNSLSGIFVKKTDKATKSAFGIVKIGDNVSVSSGKISVPLGTTENPGVLQVGSGLSVTDGVVSASASGGFTFDLIGTKEGVTDNVLDVTLTADYRTYKMLGIWTQRSGGGDLGTGFSFISVTQMQNYNDVMIENALGLVNKKSGDTTGLVIQVKGTSTAHDFYIYGIK